MRSRFPGGNRRSTNRRNGRGPQRAKLQKASGHRDLVQRRTNSNDGQEYFGCFPDLSPNAGVDRLCSSTRTNYDRASLKPARTLPTTKGQCHATSRSMSNSWFTAPGKQVFFCEPTAQLIPVFLSHVSSTRKRFGFMGGHPQSDFVRSRKTLGRNIRHRATNKVNREEEPVAQCGSKQHDIRNIQKRGVITPDAT